MPSKTDSHQKDEPTISLSRSSPSPSTTTTAELSELSSHCSTPLAPGHVHDDHHSRNETHEPHEHTTSVNRSFSDLDPVRFVFFVVLLAALRTAVQHPLNLALARKQAMAQCAEKSTREVLQGLIAKERDYYRELRKREIGTTAVAENEKSSGASSSNSNSSPSSSLPLMDDVKAHAAALTRGMTAFVGGTAASEGIYLVAFEAMREFLPISYDVTRDVVAGYSSDACCRFVHIPLMVAAYRQMVFEPSPLSATSPLSAPSVSAAGAATTATTMAGATATAAATSVAAANIIAAAHHHRPLSTPRMLAAVHKEGGVRALYAGLGTTLLVGCQWSGAWWALYGALKAPLYRASDAVLEDWEGYDARGQRVVAVAVAGGGGNGEEGGRRVEGGEGSSSLSSSSSSSSSTNYTIGALKTIRGAMPASFHSSFTKDDNMLLNGIASVAASGCTAVLFNPFLVVRTRMQVQSGLTLRGAIRDIYYEGFSGAGAGGGGAKKGGGSFKGFFRGLYLNVSVCVLDGVLSTFCYEYSRLWSDRSHLASPTPTAVTKSA